MLLAIFKKILLVSVMSIPANLFLMIDIKMFTGSNVLLNNILRLAVFGIGFILINLVSFLIIRKINKEAFNFGK